MKYRPDIDGLRAIAVIVVILFHAGFDFFSGGFVGVDVFFVISGFLITTIIFNGLKDNSFSLKIFYEKRIRRILPLLYSVVIVASIAAWFILLPSDMKSFSESILAVVIFSSNILFFKETGYWNTTSELKPMLHTWSLSVEEQYYLIFPLLLIIFFKIRKDRLILTILILFFLLSLLLSNWASTRYPEANFYLLPSRMWELLLGAIASILLIHKPHVIDKIKSNRSLNEFFVILGISMILYSVFFFNNQTPFPSFYALFPTVGSVLIILFSDRNLFAYRFLTLKPIVFVGLISYSAYLWHQPIFAFIRYLSFDEPSKIVYILAILSIFPISYLTWKYIENPFRDKKVISTKKVLTQISSISLLLFSFSFYVQYSEGNPNRKSLEKFHVKNYQPDNKVLRQKSWSILRNKLKDDKYFISENEVDNKLWYDLSDKRQKILIVGNSYSKDMYNTLYFSNYIKKNFQIARYGEQIRRLQNPKHKMYDSPNFSNADIVIFSSRFNKKDDELLEKVVANVLDYGKKVILVKNIKDIKEYGINTLSDFYIKKALVEGEIGSSIKDSIEHFQYRYAHKSNRISPTDSIIAGLATKYENVKTIDKASFMCDDDQKRYFILDAEFQKYFYDYGHNTIEGAQFFAKRIDSLMWIEKALKF